MKKLFPILIAAACALPATAQEPVQGTTYFLPRTTLRVSLLVEKTTYAPGEFADYAARYIKTPAEAAPAATCRLVGVRWSTYAVPDTAQEHRLVLDKKHSVARVQRDKNGVLLAINATAKAPAQPAAFAPAAQPAALNPRDFMNEDMLRAGTAAKTAELVAKEIYDIRESRNMLSRGEADFMPKDGEQLRLMLANLDRQERALLQTFLGVTRKDTAEVVVDFTPERGMGRQLLFRLSKQLGVVADDNLAGEPYYIEVSENGELAEPAPDANAQAATAKKSKDDIGLVVALPARATATIFAAGRRVARHEFYAAQLGRAESLSGALFGKDYTTHLTLDAHTGAVVRMETERVE